MGRWAQAARRGGGAPLPAFPVAENAEAYVDDGEWWGTWLSTSNPTQWQIQVDEWISDAYFPVNLLTVSGGDTEACLELVDTKEGRFRIRPVVGGLLGNWGDYVVLA